LLPDQYLIQQPLVITQLNQLPMETPNGSVIVELYDLALTPRKDDRFGRIVIKKSVTEDDLINIAISRRTDLNANTVG